MELPKGFEWKKATSPDTPTPSLNMCRTCNGEGMTGMSAPITPDNEYGVETCTECKGLGIVKVSFRTWMYDHPKYGDSSGRYNQKELQAISMGFTFGSNQKTDLSIYTNNFNDWINYLFDWGFWVGCQLNNKNKTLKVYNHG